MMGFKCMMVNTHRRQEKFQNKFLPEAIATLVFITIKGLRVAERWGSNEMGYKQVMQLVLSKL